MKIRKYIPETYVVLELHDKTKGRKKEVKTISLIFEPLESIINKIKLLSLDIPSDLTVKCIDTKGKPHLTQTMCLVYYRTGNKKEKTSKSITLYGVTLKKLYTKIMKTYE